MCRALLVLAGLPLGGPPATALWRCLHTGVLVSACRYCVTLKMILFCRRPATLKVCPV